MRTLPPKQLFTFSQGSPPIRWRMPCTSCDSKAAYSSPSSFSMMSGPIFPISRISRALSSYPWSLSMTNHTSNVATKALPVAMSLSTPCPVAPKCTPPSTSLCTSTTRSPPKSPGIRHTRMYRKAFQGAYLTVSPRARAQFLIIFMMFPPRNFSQEHYSILPGLRGIPVTFCRLPVTFCTLADIDRKIGTKIARPEFIRPAAAQSASIRLNPYLYSFSVPFASWGKPNWPFLFCDMSLISESDRPVNSERSSGDAPF